MNLKNAQQEVDNWIKNHGVRYFNELTNMAQLTEEVGEVPERVQKTREASNVDEESKKSTPEESFASFLFLVILYCFEEFVEEFLWIKLVHMFLFPFCFSGFFCPFFCKTKKDSCSITKKVESSGRINASVFSLYTIFQKVCQQKLSTIYKGQFLIKYS